MNPAALLKRHEGKTLEFKRQHSDSDSLLRSVVAFANTAGGTILFGVEDRTRRVVGVENPLDLEARLANVITDAVRPRLAPEIAVLAWRRTHLVAVRVHAEAGRPHYVAALGPDEGVFVRVGSTNRRADHCMLTELRRLSRNESFDEQPMAGTCSEAIDFRAASELFAPVRRLTRRDLRVLGLVVQHQGRLTPTAGGILLFGSDRGRWFPDAYVQAGRFRGTTRDDILDAVEIRAHLPEAVERAIAFVEKHESRRVRINAARHEERWSVPLLAVREAVVNAVVHAEYSQRGAPIRLSVFDDRVEIESPGLLAFGLTVEDILQGVSKVRNRVIGRVFKELGLIEQWGSGIGRMAAAYREAGLPEPRFEEVGRHFRVTVEKRRSSAPPADPVERAILVLLADGAGHATAEIARRIRRTPRATRTRLAALVARGVVVEIGSGPRDPRRRYHLADDKRAHPSRRDST
jgi:predicted HTH transcriptional regulator